LCGFRSNCRYARTWRLQNFGGASSSCPADAGRLMVDSPGGDGNERGKFSRRLLLLGGAQAAAFGLVGWRFYDLQVVHSDRYAPLAEENRINVQSLTPKRGRILDVSGRVLADNEELFRVTITPSLARNVGGVLRRVSRILPLTDEDIARLVAHTRKKNRNLPT